MTSKLIIKSKKTQKVKKELTKLKSKKNIRKNKKVIRVYQKGGATATFNDNLTTKKRTLTINFTEKGPFYTNNNAPLVIEYGIGEDGKGNTEELKGAIKMKFLKDFRILEYVNSDSLKVSTYDFFTALFEQTFKQENEEYIKRRNIAMNIACVIGSIPHYAIGLVNATDERDDENPIMTLTIVIDEKAPIHGNPIEGKRETKIEIEYKPEHFRTKIDYNGGFLQSVCKIITMDSLSISQPKTVGKFFLSAIEKAYEREDQHTKSMSHIFVNREEISIHIQACVDKHEASGNGPVPPIPSSSLKPPETHHPATATGDEHPPPPLPPKPVPATSHANKDEPQPHVLPPKPVTATAPGNGSSAEAHK